MSEAPKVSDGLEQQVLDVEGLDVEAWNEYAEAQGWSDGLPLMVPTEAAVNDRLLGEAGKRSDDVDGASKGSGSRCAPPPGAGS